MYFCKLALAAASAFTVAAYPSTIVDTSIEARQASSQQVLYWGQNNLEQSLGTYCQSGQGVDIIVLAFIYQYGNGQTPYGNFGNDCVTSQECTSLEQDVATCQAAGKKVIISLGGAVGSYSLSSSEDAQGVAQDLWDMFGNPAQSSNTSAIRPLGQNIIDGFDMDIEASAGNQYYPDLINKLRSLYATDSSKQYYITGAPQCPIPEPNMGAMIAAAKFDLLFIQFYNNPYCSAYQVVRNSNGAFNFDDWYVHGCLSYTEECKTDMDDLGIHTLRKARARVRSFSLDFRQVHWALLAQKAVRNTICNQMSSPPS